MLISNEIKQKRVLTKSDILEIESETILSNFEKENFFSLFPEQDVVYETVYDQLVQMDNPVDTDDVSTKQGSVENFAQYIHSLSNILKQPTPVSVQSDPHLTDRSILKQCILFHNIKASVMLYKIARRLPEIAFENYISSQQDLKIIVERLPAQQYLNIFNSFGQNYHTKKLTEAFMIQSGEGQQAQLLTTFIGDSAVISEYTH